MTTPSNFIVAFEVAYRHLIKVGVEAPNDLAALQQAEEAFGNATLWAEGSPQKLLHDDFHEDGECVNRYVTNLGSTPLPAPDASVQELELHSRARSLLHFCRVVSDAAPSLTEQVVDLDRLLEVRLSARSIQQIRELLPYLASIELAP